ncbi:MAG TPA: bifunctional transaldolase/phosoglucose isomerase [candidate division Zixibacteria bacterium]|nr:bifunctional transaldolase/phosoglucose isomerase [candidate division Zixibacteria bacterium]
MNPLKQLLAQGQSVWLDYIDRKLVRTGQLKEMVEENGIRGLTSNPTIFEKAITGGHDYDESLRELLKADPNVPASQLYELMAIEDIRMAADALRSVYDESDGGDGYVSLEVSPHLAHDTAATIAEARRLKAAVGRPNVMIKVPATPEGIPAIEELIAEGVNVNVTLMFSMRHYEAVARAYIKGLERCVAPSRVASVASFFVSRVDTMVDRALESLGTDPAKALRGKIAIANSKIVYHRFREIFHGEGFVALRRRGARVQRPLWASTSTKNPAYSDVLYVENLIGPDTVNTMPLETLRAFKDHGRVEGETVTDSLDEAAAALRRLAALGIDLNAIAERLQHDGVAAFAASFDQMTAALDRKRQTMIGNEAERQELHLGAYRVAVTRRIRDWERRQFARRLWSKDPTLWSEEPQPELADRLGWLDLPRTMARRVAELEAFAAGVKDEGVRDVVLLGMGGSSLAPEVFRRTFGSRSGYPQLTVLDSTHPRAVRAVEAKIDPGRTLFLVSSKSGTTTETESLFFYFWNVAKQAQAGPGRCFVAITDPGTPLEALARERGFRAVFAAPPDVGGRYSALSEFGLVPAALIGVDAGELLRRAQRMAEACGAAVIEPENPGLLLGAALGELALARRDKATFIASPSVAAFPVWVEQLIAESTGKDRKGIIPVVDEPADSPTGYGDDRLFIYLRCEGDENHETDRRVAALEANGHPVVRIDVADKSDLGQEFFRWEVAVASAGAVLGVHPFNQPDVQLAKDLAKKAIGQATEKKGRGGAGDAVSAHDPAALRAALHAWMEKKKARDYVALQAYLEPDPQHDAALQAIRRALRERLGLATTSGYGPRFLHSTGQLHKGGPNSALVLQIIDEPADDLPIPETGYSFGRLIRAQAAGDFSALKQRRRRVLRVNLGADARGGLRRLAEALTS